MLSLMTPHAVIFGCLIYSLLPHPGVGMTGGTFFILAYPQFKTYEAPVVFLHLTTTISPLTVHVKFGTQRVNTYNVTSHEAVALNPSNTFPPMGYGESVSVTSDGGQFNVTVVVKMTNTSSALFKAIPVTSWGTVYGAVILWYNPVIQVVASSNCYVKFFIYSNDVKFSITFEGNQYGPNSTLGIKMNRLESFTLSGYTTSSHFVDQISGTNISSSCPIGVISGSSPGDVFNPECLSVSLSTNEDMALEMLPPVEHYHSYFITADFKKLTKNNYLIVMAAENATSVTVKDGERTRHVILDLALFPYKVNVPASVMVTSTKPITVVNVLSNGCLDGDVYHGPSMSVVVPFNFLYATYHFIAPSLTDNTHAFVQIIIENKNLNLSDLIYDEGQIADNMTWEAHPAEQKFYIGIIAVTVNALHVIQDSAETPFWCTVFGYTTHDSYMFFAGYAGPDIARDISATTPPRRKVTRPICVINIMKPGDRIDNDCDGQRDEEKMNREDDDLDGLIDEDLERNPHQACAPGLFGKKCDKMCYCASGCNRRGICIGDNTKCKIGFYGTSCHYDSSLEFDAWKDNDDETCVDVNISSKSIYIDFPVPRVFTMMRTVLKPLGKITKSLKGKGLQIVDICCQFEKLVVSLLLKSGGHETLCTVNINGGRKFGYLNAPKMSSTYIGYDNNIAWADAAVDGVTRADSPDTSQCARPADTDLDPFWEIKFDEPIRLYYVIIYNREQPNSLMNWFVLEIFNENNVKVGEHQNHEGGRSHYEITFRTTEPVMRVRMSLSLNVFPERRNVATTLQICEFEAYGDCMPPTYGPDCLDICSLTCVDQRCNYDGECVACPPGVRGKHCMDTSQRDKDRGDFYDNHHPPNTNPKRLPVAVWRVEHTAYYVIVFSFIGILVVMNRNMTQENKMDRWRRMSPGGMSRVVNPEQVITSEGSPVDMLSPQTVKKIKRIYPKWKLNKLKKLHNVFRYKLDAVDDSDTSTAV